MLPGFDVCGECSDGLDYPTPSFSESHPLPIPCPACNGVGSVPGDTAVEALAGAHWETWWGGKRESWHLAVTKRPVEELDLYRDVARAALVAYARQVKET